MQTFSRGLSNLQSSRSIHLSDSSFEGNETKPKHDRLANNKGLVYPTSDLIFYFLMCHVPAMLN